MHANSFLKRSLLALMLIMSCSVIYAQKVVTGSVLDPTNHPVSGATVNVTGTNNSTQTDLSGNFSISVPQGKNSLTISYVGNETQTIDISDKTVVSIALKTTNNPLEGVVVVGYGTQKRSDVTGAIGTVSAKEIQDEPVLQIGQALQGKVAGLQVSQNSGAPGSGLLIRVRGTGTVNNAEPLYVVDGNPNVNPLDIAPDQIESIQVLKSASASAIYGAQGANGVVLITTKQGRPGKAQLDINFSQGWQQIQRNFDVTNAKEYAILYNEGLKDAGQALAFPNPDTIGQGTNWQKEIFQVAPMTDVSIAASGGNESSRFYFSAGYVNQEGIIKKSSFDRVTLRVNSSHTINRFIKVGQNLSASLAKYSNISEFAFGSILGTALTANPNIPPRFPDGSFGWISNSLNSTNLAASLYYTNDDTRRPVANGNAYVDLTPFKNLVFRSQYNFNLGQTEQKNFSPQWRISPQQGNDVSTLRESINRFREYSWANTLTYQNSIGNHTFDVLAGITNQESYSENGFAEGRGVPQAATENDNLRYLNLAISNFAVGGAGSEWGILSYLGRINYNFASKYFATVNFRADGSSRFGENNKWGYFPSFSLGWKVSQENFMKDIGWMDNLMIRAGWGSLGNQGSLPNYAFANLVSMGTALNYPFGTTVVRGQAPTTLGNPDLKWESTRETNLGFDFAGFNNKVTASFDWYRKKTTDMLLQVPLVGLTGITDAPFVNGGSVLNKGVEIQVGYDKRATSGLNYNISANVAFNKNKVLELSNTGTAIQQFISFVGLINSTQIGAPIASFYGWQTDGIFQTPDEVTKHAFQSNGTAPGDWRFRDLDGNDTINAKDQTIIGNPWPKATFGLTGGLSLKNFDFKLQLQGTYGNDIFQGFKFRTEGANFFNYTKNVWNNRWTGPGTSNTLPRLNTSDPNNNMRSSTYYVEDGSYLRLRNVQIGYRIPSQVSRLRSARVYFSIQNALTFTKYSGFDPEIGTNRANNPLYIGIDETNYPLPRIYTVGINVGL